MDTLDLALQEVKFAGAQDGEFSGTAITFNSPINHSYYGTDIVKPGAFNRTLAEKGTANIKMLWSHDTGQPLGRWTAMHETPGGLEVRGQLLLQVEKAREVRALMQAGILDGLSVGFSVPVGGAEVDSRRQVRTLTRID